MYDIEVKVVVVGMVLCVIVVMLEWFKYVVDVFGVNVNVVVCY